VTGLRRSRTAFLAAGGLALGLLCAGAWWWSSSRRATPPAASTGSAVAVAAKYVDNALCLGCHDAQAREWENSHHARAMAPATEASVRGDFRNRSVTFRGVTSRFFRKGEAFFVNTEGPDGTAADFEIKYTFGVDPLQQYLAALPGGRLQPLNIAWDAPRRQWFDLLPREKTPPGDVLHWTGRYQTANTMCLVCHVTGFEKSYDPAADAFASRWAEPNVSCQACHGPGDLHVQYETRVRGAGTPMADPAAGPHGLTVDFSSENARRKTESCAPCHSRRTELLPSPRPGQEILDAYIPSLLVRPLYHPDGQQLEEVYVDASFRQSRMFQKGVTCTNCHNPHSGKLRFEGNALCLQCHKKEPNPSFPTAAGDFDSPAHHFHKPGSKGASCVACHMPSTTYMRIQPRPDHSIRVPRPDVSVEIGTPDACTNCHKDRRAQWAADAVSRWYGPVRKQGAHFGEAFAAARSGKSYGSEAVAELIDNALVPAVVRATALVELSEDPAIAAEKRMQATRDVDPVLRTAAAESVAGLSVAQRISALTPLLTDPVRAVRITAARNLSFVPADQLSASSKPAFEAALAEYVATQEFSRDMPGADMNLAVVYENTGKTALAERLYRAALKIDPDFTPARANLARLYNATSRNEEAVRVLQEGLKREPGSGELQYSLGLLLAEEKRMTEATEALGQAAKLMPDRASVHYNYGLALDQIGKSGPAEAALLRAQALAPEDPSMSYALVAFYSKAGRKDAALKWAEELRKLRPNDAEVVRLIANLRAGR
jgi:predicted CXXCH cytochrome family protein